MLQNLGISAVLNVAEEVPFLAMEGWSADEKEGFGDVEGVLNWEETLGCPIELGMVLDLSNLLDRYEEGRGSVSLQKPSTRHQHQQQQHQRVPRSARTPSLSSSTSTASSASTASSSLMSISLLEGKILEMEGETESEDDEYLNEKMEDDEQETSMSDIDMDEVMDSEIETANMEEDAADAVVIEVNQEGQGSDAHAHVRYFKLPWTHNEPDISLSFPRAFKIIDSTLFPLSTSTSTPVSPQSVDHPSCSHSSSVVDPSTLSTCTTATPNKIHGAPQHKKILISCQQGISRSASLTIAYVMRVQRWRLQKAYEYVKSRSCGISPNGWFMGQLAEWEGKLFGGVGVGVGEMD
jgi:hypothetical protein